MVVGNMAEEVQRAPLPILHHMVDIWTDKGSQRKFVAVHLAYVNSNFELRDALLSVSERSPVLKPMFLFSPFRFVIVLILGGLGLDGHEVHIYILFLSSPYVQGRHVLMSGRQNEVDSINKSMKFKFQTKP